MPDKSQDPIWAHFQNEHSTVFKGARARHDALTRTVARLTAAAVPAVLNIGCGDGYFEKRARRRGWRIFSLDPDIKAVSRLTQAGIPACRGYMEALPFGDGRLDVVVASEVLEHLDARQGSRALEEVQRVLRPGGFFVGTVPYREDMTLNMVFCPHCHRSFHRWGHQRSFSRRRMRQELARFFPVVTVQRRALVSFTDGGLPRLAKSAVRSVLGRFGAPIAAPNILFTARKEGNQSTMP
jgi:SAM-dependent methyltransferase